MKMFKQYWYWIPMSIMMGFVFVGTVFVITERYKTRSKVTLVKKDTVTKGATKLDPGVMGFGFVLIGWDPHREIRSLIDSAYKFEIAKDSIARMQLRVLYSGEEDIYIKHEYNRLEGKRNRYKDMIARTYDSLKIWLERDDGRHVVPEPTFMGPSPIDSI